MEAAMPSESNWEKERKQKEKAMLKRLKSLPKDNPIVKLAIKRKGASMNESETWKKFELVEDLVSAARKCVTDGDDFNEAISDLAEALSSLVDKKATEDDDGDSE